MILPKTFRTIRCALLGTAVALAPGSPCLAAAADGDRLTDRDCGVKALFLLLQIEGRGVGIADLQRALPPRDPQGFSIAELARAAKSLGLRLDAVALGAKSPPPDRAAIAFFQDGGGGHFAVVRPVGVTGSLVQVIDPPREPEVVDYDRLAAARGWTGCLLIPQDRWPARSLVAVASAVGGVTVVTAALLRRGRAARRVRREPHPGLI